MAHPQIAVFARLADGNAPRTRAIEGQKTMLGRTMHGIDYHPGRDEIFVPQQFGQAILVFDGNANGEMPPKRVIRGPLTRIRAMDRLTVDAVNDEIYVPEGQEVLVFDARAEGNVAPKRVLAGANTMFGAATSVAVDPKRNLIVVGSDHRDKSVGGILAVFERTARGNAKPLRVIAGARALGGGVGNMRAYPEKGLVFAVLQQPGYVGVWSVEDSGNVPPRFTVGGPNGLLQKPRGLDLDPRNNAVIVSDKSMNAVLTYEVPEIFGAPATSSSSR